MKFNLAILFFLSLFLSSMLNFIAFPGLTETKSQQSSDLKQVVIEVVENIPPFLLQSNSGSFEVFTLNESLVQAQKHYQNGEYQNVITLLEKYLKIETNPPEESLSVEIYRYLGLAYQKIGRKHEAIVALAKASDIYRRAGSKLNKRDLATVLTEQATAYISLGQNQKAISLTEEAIQLTEGFWDKTIAARAQGTLGNAYFFSGDEEKATMAFSQSLKLASSQNLTALEAAALNNLTVASVRLSQKQRRNAQLASQEKDELASQLSKYSEQSQAKAKEYALQAVAKSDSFSNQTTVRALLNLLPFVEGEKRTYYQQKTLAIVNKLPDSQAKAYLLIDLAKTDLTTGESIRLLEDAVQISRFLQDNRGLSFALGELGQIYEREEQYDRALDYTQQAQLVAGQILAYDSLYQWFWQMGRIYRTMGNEKYAITSYQAAIASLQKIRGDIAIAAKDFQLDFRDRVEPIYRELLALKLESGQIEEANNLFASLQLSELESFFGDICVEVTPSIDSQQLLAQTHSAVITTIVLPQKTYLILQLPDGTTRTHLVAISANQLNQEIEQWRNNLEDFFTLKYLAQSQKLYDWLIRPLEADLEAVKPKILIFVGDGLLRNVPMAALHDGTEYLVEKYPIAVSLGLNLIRKKESERKLSPLIFGLSKARPPFNEDLPYVAVETQEVKDILGGKRFLDRDFTWNNFREQFLTSKSEIVHLATHGRFSGTLERSFLQMSDRSIGLNELESLFNQRQQAIDLLVLSACQTAAGNNRTVLGLAGIALRSGVQSVLASLWFSNDAATTELIVDFYQNWQVGMTKAEALQKTQLKQIKKPLSHPNQWSNFVLIE
jgi:CHAT domain-containing protein